MEKVRNLLIEHNYKDEATIQAKIEMCKELVLGADTCDESWELAKCFSTHTKE